MNCHYSNYTEELLVGYRYYAANHITPAYCFGHGLSFVDFRYSSLSVSPTAVSFDLEHTGVAIGAHMAHRSLVAGNRIDCRDGEQQQGHVRLPASARVDQGLVVVGRRRQAGRPSAGPLPSCRSLSVAPPAGGTKAAKGVPGNQGSIGKV